MRIVTSTILAVALIAAAATATAAAGSDLRVYRTRRVIETPPHLDGHLDDSAWRSVEWSGDFVQREPTDGAEPSHQTRFKVTYDDRALYVGIQAFDDPAQISSRLARRDWFPGDWVEVNIDSRADNRTAYSFTLSVSGTRGDEYISEDGRNWDGNWDPVWEGATAIGADGWTAEMRIPLSQLRFDAENPRPWGLQVQRQHFRQGERSTWQRIPREVSGWVSRFGDLCGIEDLAPAGRAEIMPYVSAQHDRFASEAGNPFRDGTDSALSAGVDAKFGLTDDISVDLTINPDFGQVEADPSQVNLSAFETYFSEKRPFFIEGADVLRMPLAPAIAGGSFTSDRLFYSRRIGKRPSVRPDLADGEFGDVPDQTSILGAAKLTGKTAGGLSVGFLESVTARERADISGPGGDRDETVEPLTNFMVGRISQDLRGGDTVVGGMLTSVVRDIDDPHLQFLERQAWAGGVDLQHHFHDRDFRLDIRLLGSHLRGSEESILDAQTAPARYFQRPDNAGSSVDSTRTTLGGHAGSVMLMRTSNGSKLSYQGGVAWRSPGFEINDLGFMRRADEINEFFWIGYSQRDPSWIFNHWTVNANQWLDWDFDGRLLSRSVNVNANGETRSQHSWWVSAKRTFDHISNTELRGGPSSRCPADWNCNAGINSDPRRALRMNLGGWALLADQDDRTAWNIWGTVIYQPTNRLRLALYPSFDRDLDATQYVTTTDHGGRPRYVFGELDQRTASLTFRADLCLTPDLTIQYYGSPFVSSGRYADFKRVTDPRADRYDDRFHAFDGGEISTTDDGFAVDEDGDGDADYSWSDPDFNVREFNSNLVLRWEYGAGSTVYVVWSQSRGDFVRDGSFDLSRDMDALFGVHPHDVFLVKVNTWFSL